MALARERNFKSCVAQTTGAYSQRIFEALGMKAVAHVSYATFEYEGRTPFADVLPPHKDFTFLEVQFV